MVQARAALLERLATGTPEALISAAGPMIGMRAVEDIAERAAALSNVAAAPGRGGGGGGGGGEAPAPPPPVPLSSSKNGGSASTPPIVASELSRSLHLVPYSSKMAC